MSRRWRKGNSSQRFVGLPHYVLNSSAFKTMPGDAVKVLLEIWKRHNGYNNGEISYGVREADEIGITKSQAARMLEILVERGFLAVIRESGFNRKRLSRTWRITAEPCRGEKATKEFMTWKLRSHSPTEGTARGCPETLHSPVRGTHSPPPVGQQ